MVCFAVTQWSGWPAQVSCGPILHRSREVSVHWLPVAEAARGAWSGAQWWVAPARATLLWSLSLRQSRAWQSCHGRRHLFHQEVVRHNSCELSCHLLSALLLCAIVIIDFFLEHANVLMMWQKRYLCRKWWGKMLLICIKISAIPVPLLLDFWYSSFPCGAVLVLVNRSITN